MGHMDTVGAMPPVEERRGCKGVWPARANKDDVEHEVYDNDCAFCFIANGGRMD
jgi:hypothetical protein